MDKLLTLLEKNARLKESQIAAMLDTSEAEVAAAIEKYEQDGVIRGYRAVIDWDKTDRQYVIAHIELRVTPKRDLGFDEIANTIISFDEVESCYLMSGGYDLALTVSGKDFRDIALFVSQKLATLDSVLSTSTHFQLKVYKEGGVSLSDEETDMREGGLL